MQGSKPPSINRHRGVVPFWRNLWRVAPFGFMAAKFPYYLLADSPGGRKKVLEIGGLAGEQLAESNVPRGGNGQTSNDVKKGFVYKRVPHVTLKSIANKKDGLKLKVIGPDDFGHMILDKRRKAGVQNTVKNERLKFYSLEPYAAEWIHGKGTYTDSDGSTKTAAICIGAEFGTVRPALVKEAATEAVKGVGFDLLIVCGFAFDPHVSEEAKRYGKLTVLPARMNPDLAMGDELLKKTGAGNLFTVFGEPDIEIRKVGLASRARPETRQTARSMVREKSPDRVAVGSVDEFVVEIRGLDVYDPTTGEIRNSSTDDIACWFIDTDNNGESFFVRHAYFTGADEPYDKLKRALRAEINEAAWSSLYSTTSRPFDKPKSGKIAVKVINHYGDEVLKVFDV